MNWDLLRTKLVQAARQARSEGPSDRVPYAFEKRVMARLADSAHGPAAFRDEPWAIVRALWWAAGACSAIALTISVWSFEPQGATADFSEDLEETILASVHEPDGEVDWDQWQ